MLAFISDTGMAIAAIAFIALFGASHIPQTGPEPRRGR